MTSVGEAPALLHHDLANAGGLWMAGFSMILIFFQKLFCPEPHRGTVATSRAEGRGTPPGIPARPGAASAPPASPPQAARAARVFPGRGLPAPQSDSDAP